MTFIVSGYGSDEEFDLRTPSWESGDLFRSTADAEEAARIWLSQQDPDAVVELIELSLDGSEGWVRQLISRGDTEQIRYPGELN